MCVEVVNRSMNNGKISNLKQICSLNRYTAIDGVMQGLRVIDCTNGRLRFIVNESKALDIMQVYYEGENVSFISKNGFIAERLPFVKRFEGGMLYTCGLDCVGEVAGYDLHGSLHNTPATLTRMECTEIGIVIEGYMRDSALFGKNLVLKRKITSLQGSDRIDVEDMLINEGTKEENYALLYHVNLGYPMLDSDGRIQANVDSIVARNNWAQTAIGKWDKISEPKENYPEMCYFLNVKDGKVAYQTKGKRFELAYSQDTLPKFIVWKSMSCGDYALGLEPSTTELDDNYTLQTIQPNEMKKFTISMQLSRG